MQVMDWWRERGNDLSPGDHAIHLDLLSKIEGVDAAEKYFERLPEHARNKLTYGALLHCYCKENMLEKAMTLLEKMRELNYASTPLVYNNLMSMLVSMGKPGSVPPVYLFTGQLCFIERY
ncbi:hypothetical protein IFM89_009589 [Coptis chinensis]|uniref:Pentatricopeptide repeat-containing protein n=1 Tax=Coptis chinensis TaxID=261450 RepID=A0A835M501_9MAGN|nr:hypothetical protein IFM89_009589 [Coptis chinensis]